MCTLLVFVTTCRLLRCLKLGHFTIASNGCWLQLLMRRIKTRCVGIVVIKLDVPHAHTLLYWFCLYCLETYYIHIYMTLYTLFLGGPTFQSCIIPRQLSSLNLGLLQYQVMLTQYLSTIFKHKFLKYMYLLYIQIENRKRKRTSLHQCENRTSYMLCSCIQINLN